MTCVGFTDPEVMPRLGEERYGSRPIRFTDTGERAHVATVDGVPVALEASREALERFAADHALTIVTSEHFRHVRRHAEAFGLLPLWRRRRLLDRLGS
jgi:hypothetical protein